jgi:hypothetical protein
MNFIDEKTLKSFWYESGTPTFLIEFLLQNLDEYTVSTNACLDGSDLEASDIGNLQLIPLLFQTGYLTIKKRVDAENYLLKIPNGEVARAFNTQILANLTGQNGRTIKALSKNIRTALATLDATMLKDALRGLLLPIPHQLFEAKENWFHAIFLTAFQLIDLKVESERSESEGRNDMFLSLPPSGNFVVEFKYGKFEENPKVPSFTKSQSPSSVEPTFWSSFFDPECGNALS